jgi:hypothetical protein
MRFKNNRLKNSEQTFALDWGCVCFLPKRPAIGRGEK